MQTKTKKSIVTLFDKKIKRDGEEMYSFIDWVLKANKTKAARTFIYKFLHWKLWNCLVKEFRYRRIIYHWIENICSGV